MAAATTEDGEFLIPGSLFLVACCVFLDYWHVRGREWSATGQRVVSVQGWEVCVALGYSLVN
jgi:hypothetical protein